jgi:hypothetical protein
MVAVGAATMDAAEAAGAVVAEMLAIVPVPSVAAILIPEGAVAAPIPVNKGAIIAVIIAVIIVGDGTWDTYADTDTAYMDSDADLGICGCRANQGQHKSRSDKIFHGEFLMLGPFCFLIKHVAYVCSVELWWCSHANANIGKLMFQAEICSVNRERPG